MFGGLGQMAGLLTQLPKIRAEMDKLQEQVGRITATGTAGGGVVSVRVNGRLEVLGVQLTDDALRQDREMLEDLICAATNQALDKARTLTAEETAKLASNLGLPPGMKLPGLG
jgi:hypothetical protein